MMDIIAVLEYKANRSMFEFCSLNQLFLQL